MAAAEFAAVAFGVAYILLAIREHRACWIAGGIGTAISAVVFLDAGSPMQAALQLVYVATVGVRLVRLAAVARGRGPVRSWPWSRHLAAAAAIGVATAITAPLAARYALAAAPVADSLGAWASVFATWLLARRIIDTWAWWIVIDAGLAALCAHLGLWMFAGLYLAYAILAVAGWRSWRARSRAA